MSTLPRRRSRICAASGWGGWHGREKLARIHRHGLRLTLEEHVEHGAGDVPHGVCLCPSVSRSLACPHPQTKGRTIRPER